MSGAQANPLYKQQKRLLILLCNDLIAQLGLAMPFLNRKMTMNCNQAIQSLETLSSTLLPPSRFPSEMARDDLDALAQSLQTDTSKVAWRIRTLLLNLLEALHDLSQVTSDSEESPQLEELINLLSKLNAARQSGARALWADLDCSSKCQLRTDVRLASASLWTDGSEVRDVTWLYYALKNWTVCVSNNAETMGLVQAGMGFIQKYAVVNSEDSKNFSPSASTCRYGGQSEGENLPFKSEKSDQESKGLKAQSSSQHVEYGELASNSSSHQLSSSHTRGGPSGKSFPQDTVWPGSKKRKSFFNHQSGQRIGRVGSFLSSFLGVRSRSKGPQPSINRPSGKSSGRLNRAFSGCFGVGSNPQNRPPSPNRSSGRSDARRGGLFREFVGTRGNVPGSNRSTGTSGRKRQFENSRNAERTRKSKRRY